MATETPDLTMEDEASRLAHAHEILVRDVARLAAIFDPSPIGVGMWTIDGELLHANPVLRVLFKRDRDDLVGELFERFIDRRDAAAIVGCIADIWAGRRNFFECSMRCFGPDDAVVWLQAFIAPVYGPGGEPRYLISQIYDFTSRERATRVDDAKPAAPAARPEAPAAVREAEVSAQRRAEHLQRVLDASHDLVLAVRPSGVVSYAGGALAKQLAIDADGECLIERLLTDESLADYRTLVGPSLERHGEWRGELMISFGAERLPIGALFVARKDGQGEIEGVSVVASDLSDVREAQVRLRHVATHDELTGLPNRTLLHDRLEQALARYHRLGTPVAVVSCNLDGFGPVNERHGTDGGDAVLVEMARRLRSVIRATDTASRLDADDFAVIIEGVQDLDLLRSIGGRILEAARRAVDFEDEAIELSASVGMVLATPACDTVEDLLATALRAQAVAKDGGPGQLELLVPK